MTVNSKPVIIGYFDVEENAAKAYAKSVEKSGGLDVAPKMVPASQFVGVHWHTRHGQWAAKFVIPGEKNQVHIGFFDTEEAAAQARHDYVLTNSR